MKTRVKVDHLGPCEEEVHRFGGPTGTLFFLYPLTILLSHSHNLRSRDQKFEKLESW